jgi:hypothetical protein
MYAPGDLSLDSLTSFTFDRVTAKGYKNVSIYSRYTVKTTRYRITVEMTDN